MMSYVGALHFTSILSLSCVVLWYMGGLWTFNKSIKNHSAKEEMSQAQENCPE